ncbi:MAG: helix-turn-helix transcriptional regulator [Porticoccaceae bacterium]|nr:helix-turn-helix transcriptional regulator [Porticoccaceae bacterium]
MTNTIELYRKKAGLTQTELAKSVGWNQARVSNYERSDRKPDVDDARMIVMAFSAHGVKLTLDQLFPPAVA